MCSFIVKRTNNTKEWNRVCGYRMGPLSPSWDIEWPAYSQKALEELDIEIRNKWALHPHENESPTRDL